MNKLDVGSTAFDNDTEIPPRYTCDGDDVSPPISWSAGPSGTVSYALIVDDPDAPGGTWVHWVAWNLVEPRLDEALPASSEALQQGTNSWGRTGYGGPCPPSGTHRYFFKVYALDTLLELPPTTDKQELLDAMEGKTLAQGELLGHYARR